MRLEAARCSNLKCADHEIQASPCRPKRNLDAELHALLDAEFGPQLKRTPGSPNAAQKTNAKVEK